MKVHGLSNDWVEADWPFLTLAEVDGVLHRYPEAGGAVGVLSHSPRPFSAASVVATPRGRVFVKRHSQLTRNRAGLMEEHRFLEYLRNHGGAVPAVLADVDGQTVSCTEPWSYEVHTLAEGLDLYEQELSWTPFHSAQQAGAAGRALAHLHRAAAGYQAEARQARALVTSFSIFAEQAPMPAMERYVSARPALAEYLSGQDWRAKTEATLLPYHAGLRPWLLSLAPLWTHNDLHASNLFWSSAAEDAEPVAIIDFGLADRTNAAHDLATAIERNGVRWLELEGTFDQVVHLDHILALLQGYEQVQPLTAAEAHGVAALLPLVHVEFALSEADYFLRVLHSPERADMAWQQYCLGHADWFGTDPGKRLLNALEVWAGRERRDGTGEQVNDVPA